MSSSIGSAIFIERKGGFAGMRKVDARLRGDYRTMIGADMQAYA